jgi:Fic family protein
MKYPNKEQLFRRLNSTPRELELLATDLATKTGQWIGGANLSPQILGQLKKTSLITSAGSSTRIEGSEMTDDEIRALIDGLRWTKMKNRDEQEVKGYYELLSFLYDNYTEIEITENNIKELHSRLLKYSDKDRRHKGEYKKLENDVRAIDAGGRAKGVLFQTSSSFDTPEHMRELVAWYNEAIVNPKYHKPIVVAGFIIQFLKIHPFQDGNGRLSRILTDLMLLQNGYEYMPYVSLEKIIEESKAEYYIALRSSQITFGTHHESIEKWVKFFLGVAIAQADEALSLLTMARIEQNLSENQMKVWAYFKEHQGDFINVGLLEKTTGVNRETIKQALRKLMILKMVERFGAGRATTYKYNKDLK